jgi:putative peptide maturation dehydrogenase
MERLKRPAFLFLFRQDQPFLDVEQLLRGTLASASVGRSYALSAARGEAVPISDDQLGLVVSLPSDEWVEPSVEDVAAFAELAQEGIVLSDGDDPKLAEFRRRDERLAETGWNPYSALFHFHTRWRDVDLRPKVEGEPIAELPPISQEAVERFVADRGKPPPAFHSVADGRPALELPLVGREDGLFGLLTRRRTTRAFDGSRRLALHELALVLRYVFGVHGYAPMLDEVVTLKRTSPSGGGLHPVEAYPLVADVEGVGPGLYHYRARDHALEPIETLESSEAARALATDFMCGQAYFGSAHVTFVLTARFERSHWKYRNHDKAYPAMLMDAAHLSQTLYLVATSLELGAFVTAAVNGANIEERLRLDGYSEGVLAVAGCGPSAAEPSPFDPRFLPYEPRETRL